MDFAIFGGDARFVRLAELLRADGHRVRAFALPDGCASAAEAAEGAACVILPLPALRDGRVNAPLAAAEPPAADALAAVFNLVRDINTEIQNGAKKETLLACADIFDQLTGVLGLVLGL